MTPNECLSYWLIEELIAQGITQFCISPGSRSTPLTVAAARHPQAITQIFLDERAAAYFALGWARATDQAAVLICTSGTAGANYYPAIIEASVEHLPLLAITADRPPELQQTGANQQLIKIDFLVVILAGFMIQDAQIKLYKKVLSNHGLPKPF